MLCFLELLGTDNCANENENVKSTLFICLYVHTVSVLQITPNYSIIIVYNFQYATDRIR